MLGSIKLYTEVRANYSDHSFYRDKRRGDYDEEGIM